MEDIDIDIKSKELLHKIEAYNPHANIALIDKAVKSYSDASSIRARSRIVGNFQAQKRRSELLMLLNNLRSR